jgi:hypothetical protein
MSNVTADLEFLAGKVAEQLVARALQQLASGAAPMTITVHAEPTPRKLLGSGRKKPGPKPGAKKKAAPKPLFRFSGEARRAGKAAAAETAEGLPRRCRKCTKHGTAKALGDGTARCSSCGHTWTLRRSKFETVAPAPQKKPNAKPAAGCCTRCDHSLTRHVEFTGKCLEPRCVCAEAVA